MIARIQSHSIVNGVAFVICEFALIALIVAPLGVAWALAQRPVYALLAAGIVANCLCVVGVGVLAWLAGDRGSSLRLLFSSANRAKLSKEHPRMSEDTLAIMVGTLVPFGLALLTLVDYSRSRVR
ncbi:MAG TPA: hypothetical protein VND96_01490 [Candidatus Micrarchaeaceae archaeon]|nr:hypothetical protein [Candidatus Micrarchaeaceae archaeon]